jgi:hypothetical protein
VKLVSRFGWQSFSNPFAATDCRLVFG